MIREFYDVLVARHGAQRVVAAGCGYASGPHPNRVAPDIEQAILAYSLQHPTHGPLRVAQEMALRGVMVSSGGVRGVWSRHDLLSKHDRLLRLEREQRDHTLELNDEQIRLLERFSPEFRERQIEVHHTGELVAIDTFFVGTLKALARSICKPCWTAIAGSLSDGSTIANCPSPQCMF